MSQCIFCKIAAGDIPCKKVYSDEALFAFEDISPQAPAHTLIVPREHIPTLNDLRQSDVELVGKMVLLASKIAKEKGLDAKGFRLVANCQESAGQSVFHIHMHLLGGRDFGWPPG